MTRREQLERSIAEARAKKAQTPDNKSGKPLATVANKSDKKPAAYEAKIGEKPPCSQRKAKARDARACARGRLPIGTKILSDMTGPEEWTCSMVVPKNDGTPHTLWSGKHTSKGLFQCLEELDLMYRKWLAENQGSFASSTTSENS